MFKEAYPVWMKDKEKEMNFSLLFKAVINCNAKQYIINIAASTVYQLFVNGIFLAAGPARCAHGYYRIDEIDISSALKPGDNRVVILVAGYNINNYYTLNQPSFLQAEITETESGKVMAATGSDKVPPIYYREYKERIQRTDKYSFQRTFTEVYKLTPVNEDFKLPERTKPKNLTYRRLPPYLCAESPVVSVVGRGAVAKGGKETQYIRTRHVANIGPAQLGFQYDELEVCLEDEVQALTFTCRKVEGERYCQDRLSSNETVIYALEAEKTGFISAEFECFSDTVLFMVFDERLRDGNDVDGLANAVTNVIKVEMVKGNYAFVSFEPYGFKYIKFACLSGLVNIKNVHIKEYVCPVPLRSLDEIIDKAHLDDVDIKGVLDAAVNTFRQNAVDIFMDCPTRERAGWLCDSFFTARAEKILTGSNLIAYNFLENFLLPDSFECIPDGMLPMCYPSDHYDHIFIPNWAMWFILQLYDFSKRNGGDPGAAGLVSGLRPKVYQLLKYFSGFENEYGLLEKLESWVFIEWSRANDFVQDVSYPSNMLYSKALISSGKLYNDEDLIEKGKRIKETILKRSFNGEYFTDNEIRTDGKPVSTGERSETCQYYAFFCDIATPGTHEKLWHRLVTEFGPARDSNSVYPDIYPSNAFIGAVLRLDLLKRYGLYNKVVDEVKRYFTDMAERTGTLWENLTPVASCNHGFTSYVVYLLGNKE